jgi:hypothetical protein
MSRIHSSLAAALLAAALAAPSAQGEELILKSGEKVVGTIVGYEGDMFKVETEFGFALIRRDKVETIRFGPGDAKPAAAPREEKPRAASPAARPAPVATPPPPASRPLQEPPPAQITERLEGNLYVNDTFRFAMYRPPGWRIYEGVARATGRAIAALGTQDETTVMVVDRQVWSGEPNIESEEVEKLLRQSYQEYRQLSRATMTLDGRPAVRRTFTGVMDGIEWHGISVHVARDNTLFGLIGLTAAETHEFHQAVLKKMIDSFEFLPAPAQTAGR